MNSVMKEKFGTMIFKRFQSTKSSFEYFRFGKGILSKLIETVCQLVTEKETTRILDIGTGFHLNDREDSFPFKLLI